MKKGAWKNRIIAACVDAGTYEKHFDHVIITLAEILEKRDEAAKEYKRLGSQPIVRYTNKGGATNPTKNPALVVWDELNKSALAYWRDLGLTPAGLKKIKGDQPEIKKESALEKALREMTNE